MPAWNLAGTNDLPPAIYFRARAACPLATASHIDFQALEQAERRNLFGRACRHSGCIRCGPHQAQRTLLPFAGDLEHIQDSATSLVFRWPVVESGRRGLQPLSQFFDAAGLLAHLLHDGHFGEMHVWCLVSEIAPLNKAQARPHLHLTFLRNHVGMVQLIGSLIQSWIMLGGEWQGSKAHTNTTIAGALRYLAKGALGHAYGSPSAEACATFLLDPYEHETWTSASAFYRGGTLTCPATRRSSRARARATAEGAATIPKDTVGTLRDAALAESLPASLTSLEVEHVVRCPICKRSGRFLTRNGRDERGNQRWRCKHCTKTFRDRPVSQRQAEHLENRQLATRLRKLIDDDGMSLPQAARELHIGRKRANALLK